MKKLIMSILLTLFGAYAYAVKYDKQLLKDFVYLDTIYPSIDQKLGFAADDNVLGVCADGYEVGHAICTKEAALELSKFRKSLKRKDSIYK